MLDVLRNSPILVTGAAGFIGFHTVKALIDQGAENVIGIDNINDYYDPDPKAIGKMATRKGGFISDIDLFDANFFRMSSSKGEPPSGISQLHSLSV